MQIKTEYLLCLARCRAENCQCIVLFLRRADSGCLLG